MTKCILLTSVPLHHALGLRPCIAAIVEANITLIATYVMSYSVLMAYVSTFFFSRFLNHASHAIAIAIAKIRIVVGALELDFGLFISQSDVSCFASPRGGICWVKYSSR